MREGELGVDIRCCAVEFLDRAADKEWSCVSVGLGGFRLDIGVYGGGCSWISGLG